MEEATLSKRASFLVLLLILLLHSSMLLLLLFAYHVPGEPFIPSFTELFQKKQTLEDEWVATYGHSGAPVIFADAPSMGSEQPIALVQQNRQNPLTANPRTPTASIQKDLEEPNDKKVEIAHKQSEKPLERSPLDLIAHEEPAPLPAHEETEALHESKPQAIKPSSIDQAFDSVAHNIGKQSSGSGTASESHAGQASQKNISLAQLARGFAQHIANEGNDAFSSAGKRDGKITAEQIIFAQYNDKISECLTNSLQIHKDKFYLTQNNKARMALLLEIARDGTIKNLEIVSGSGIPYVDKFMLFVFRDAASSFPPLPTHFKDETFKTIRTFSHAIASIKNPSAGYWTPVR